MRIAGAAPSQLVLPAGPAVGDDAGVAGSVGRAVHAAAVLWVPPDARLVAEPGVPGQSETRPAPAAALGPGDALPEAPDEHARPRPWDRSVSVARPADHARGPGRECGQHLPPVGTGVAVPGGHSRLVQPVRRGL